MKKIITTITAATLVLGLSSCGSSFDEEVASAAANEKCEEDVLQHAKNPASVEFVNGPHGTVREYSNYAPEDYEGNIFMVATTIGGEAHFPNAFGVMSEMTFGCVAYFNEAGELAGADYEVHEGSDGARYSFGYPEGLNSVTAADIADSLLNNG